MDQRTKSMKFPNPTAPFNMNMNLNMNNPYMNNPFMFQQFANSSFSNQASKMMPTRSMRQAFPSPYSNLQAFQNLQNLRR